MLIGPDVRFTVISVESGIIAPLEDRTQDRPNDFPRDSKLLRVIVQADTAYRMTRRSFESRGKSFT